MIKKRGNAATFPQKLRPSNKINLITKTFKNYEKKYAFLFFKKENKLFN